MPAQDARSTQTAYSASIAVIDWAGQRWHLLADRAVFWPAASMLIIADLHLGKSAAFRVAGIPVPEQTTRSDLARLALLMERTAATRVLFLGDLLHASTGRTRETLGAFTEFRSSSPAAHVDMLLVRGNHDAKAGDPPQEWGITCFDEPLCPSALLAGARGSLAFRHHPPKQFDARATPIMAGHLHPGITLDGPARSRLRARCFHVTPSCMILPAFGSFTGLAPINPVPGDRVFAIADDEIIEISYG